LGCYISHDEKGENVYAQYDLGQAVANLTLQATALGYYTHQMGGFDKQKAPQVIENVGALHPKVMIAVGKIGDYEKADEVSASKDTKPRERKTDLARQI
jgi:nitroreductase